MTVGSAVIGHRARSSRASLALPGLAFALAGAALLQGGYWPEQRALVAVILAVLALVSGRWLPERGVGLGIAVVAGGLGVSALATGADADAAGPVLILVAGASAYALARRVAAAEGTVAVIEAVSAVGAIVGILGLAGVAWHVEPLALRADTWRLASTLTYQNAAASLLALSLGPAIASAAWRRTPIARAMLVIVGVALLATLSRGGYLAAAVTVVWMLRARVIRIADVARPVVAITFGALAVVPATLGWSWSGPVTTAGLGLAVVIGIGGPWMPSRRWMTASIALALAATAALLATTPLGARFTVSSTDRGRVWSHTIDAALERPWFGTGPGSYTLIAPAGEQLVLTRYAHNEYLQWFSEAGVVGAAALLAGLALIARAIRRRARGRGIVRTAAVAGLAGFAAHAAVDFVWHVPVLVAIAFVLVAIATAGGTER